MLEFFIIQADAEEFLTIAKSKQQGDEELNADLMKLFSSCAAGNVCPIQAVIGGIAAQEVMKVIIN